MPIKRFFSFILFIIVTIISITLKMKIHDRNRYGDLSAPEFEAVLTEQNLPVLYEPTDCFGYPYPPKSEEIKSLADNVNVFTLDSMVKKFDLLSRTDYRYENHVGSILTAVSESSLGLSCINQWIERIPASPYGYLARADYHDKEAWKARTYATIDKISPAQLEKMRAETALEYAMLDSVRARDPKVLYQWELLQAAAHTISDLSTMTSAYNQSLSINPYLRSVRTMYMNSLRPRWYGNWDSMEKFAEQCDSLMKFNPALSSVRSVFYSEMADDRIRRGDTSAAVELYKKASNTNPLDTSDFQYAVYLLSIKKEHIRVVEYCREKLKYSPSDTAVLRTSADALYAVMDTMTSKEEAFPHLLELRDNCEKLLTIDPNHARALEFKKWYTVIILHSDSRGRPL